MTRTMQQMTAALVLPQAMAFEMMARTAALWSRRMAEAMRPAADPAAALALPPAEAPQARLAAPDPAPAEPVAALAPQAAQPVDEAREGLAEADADSEEIVPHVPSEETGGPAQDIETIVDEATHRDGERDRPEGAVA